MSYNTHCLICNKPLTLASEKAAGRCQRCFEQDLSIGCDTSTLHPGETPQKVLHNRKAIYIASKTIHAETWKSLRDDAGVNIICSWIDETGRGESIDLNDLAQRCIRECAIADAIIVYRYPGEYLKGAFIEMGVGLAHQKIIYLVGPVLPDSSVFTKAPNVYQCDTIEEAIYKLTGERVQGSRLEEAEAPAAQPALPEHNGPDVLPEDIKAHLEGKIRPYHSRQSFIAGCIELWEYLQAHQQPTEISALGEPYNELWHPQDYSGRNAPKEPVPAQQSTVPTEIKDWMDDRAESDADNDTTLWHNGAIAMYHHDQDERDFLQSEIMGYKKVYALAIQEKNVAEEQIKALQSEAAEYREILEYLEPWPGMWERFPDTVRNIRKLFAKYPPGSK